MYIAIKNDEGIEFADAEFSYLTELLRSVDKTLDEVNNQISQADAFDVECLYDKCEYFIGVGFCAMQRYLFDTLQDQELDPGLARQLGPKNLEGVAIAQIIHAAANYWKHSPEWDICLTEFTSRSQNTIDRVLHGRDFSDYPLAALLSDLSEEGALLLSNCLPILRDWRLAVYLYVTNNV